MPERADALAGAGKVQWVGEVTLRELGFLFLALAFLVLAADLGGIYIPNPEEEQDAGSV